MRYFIPSDNWTYWQNYQCFVTAFTTTAIMVLTTGCGAGGDLPSVSGTVTVNGAPVEIGTIHFRPADAPQSRGAGASIEEGRFQLPTEHGLEPGKYSVSVEASQKTGQTYNHPQRGPTPRMKSLTLADSPQEVDVTDDNSSSLSLSFTTNDAQ